MLSLKTPLLALPLFCLFLSPLSCITGTTGCDFRESGPNKPEPRCQERSGLQGGDAFEASCSALQAEAIDGGCPREGIVSGCDISGDGTVIDWYYAPKTADEVAADCTGEGGTVVSP